MGAAAPAPVEAPPEQRLAAHACAVRFEDLPPAALEGARREVLWCLGTSFAGAAAPGSDVILEYARSSGGAGACTVIGAGERLAPQAAGFANGCFAKALEYEDKWWMDYGCAYAIGTAVVPAAFAMAEHLGGVDGRSFLAAVAVATDVEARLIKVVPEAIYTGWNPSYLFAAFGAAVAAGRLLGLDAARMQHALGLVYAQTAGNRQNMLEGTLGNRMQMGFAVRNGLAAAQLAALGANGAQHFLTGRFGVYPLFLGQTRLRTEVLTERLGEHFLGAELGFKAWPCCAATHPALDAVDALCKSERFTPEDVESVRILGSERMRITVEPLALRQVPRTQPDAQFSVAWSAACLIIDGRLRLSHYTDVTLGSPRYAALSARVQTEMERERETVSVEIRLRDGRRLHSPPGGAPRGHPENPLSLDQVRETFRDCLQNGLHVLPEGQGESAERLALRLQDAQDVRALIRLLA